MEQTGSMTSLGLQLLGIGLAMLGWLGSIIICVLPMWKVSAILKSTIVISQKLWEGLWLSCVVQSTGQIQCRIYDSPLSLPLDTQAARVMVVIAIFFSLFGLLLSVVRGKCTTCVADQVIKARMVVSAGAFFILSGALCLVTVSLLTSNIIRDFHDPLVPDTKRREVGSCLYLGWGVAAMLMVGGALLCCQGWRNATGTKYSASKSTTPMKELSEAVFQD